MSPKAAVTLIIALAIIIALLSWLLWTTPASAPTVQNAATSTATTSIVVQ